MAGETFLLLDCVICFILIEYIINYLKELTRMSFNFQVWPRQGRSLIVTQEEMKKMKDDKIRKVLKKYDEVVFSGLTQEQKDVIELFTWQFTLFVMC